MGFGGVFDALGVDKRVSVSVTPIYIRELDIQLIKKEQNYI